MSQSNLQVNGYIRKNKRWQDELQALRTIILDCQLTEEVKWRVPCYTYQGHNVVFLGAFKESCVLSFVKGALLKDQKEILIQQTKNSQSVRVIRFTGVGEIGELETVLKGYIQEAMDVEKAGLKIEFKKTEEFDMPEELRNKFEETPSFRAAFAALTPGRQRGYLLHFAAPKQSKTRDSRIEKCREQILQGKGLDDDYVRKAKK